MVRTGRKAELEILQRMGVWEVVPRSQAEAAGKRPVTLKWVEKGKAGADGKVFCRSRLVAREIKKAMKTSDRPSESDIYASMLPAEALKLLLSWWANQRTIDGSPLVFVFLTFHGPIFTVRVPGTCSSNCLPKPVPAPATSAS